MAQLYRLILNVMQHY